MNQPSDKHDIEFDIMSVRAGDIIFVLPESSGFGKLKQLINIWGQRFLAKIRTSARGKSTRGIQRYSHVMLGAGDGLIIHADGKVVSLEIVTEALDFKLTKYKIYRHANVSDDIAKQIARSGMRYLRQKYSFIAYFGKLRENDITQFCSRLVAHAYRSAGVPLSELPENNVLPLDLYLLCQAAPWCDITANSLSQKLSPELRAIFSTIDNPEGENMAISDPLEKSDQTILNSLKLQKDFYNLMHSNHKDILQTEVLMERFCIAELHLAKILQDHPRLIDDKYSEKVVRVLNQIEPLLSLAWLPEIDMLIEKNYINTDPHNTGKSAYAGLPCPAAILEMQITRETVRVFTYLTLAQTGLSSILDHHLPHEKLQKFRSVEPKYIDRFLLALPNAITLQEHQDLEDAFSWISNISTRQRYQSVYKNIQILLKLIQILSKGTES